MQFIVKRRSLQGSSISQHNFISKSYRYRGNVPRIHTNRYPNIVVLKAINKLQTACFDTIALINNRDVRSLIKSILLYSAKARSAKPDPPNSTINPATSSDSPSTKSKGVRFVSARQEVTHNIITSVIKITFIIKLSRNDCLFL